MPQGDRRNRRWRAVLAAGIALVVVLAGGFVGWRMLGGNAEREVRRAAERFASAWSAGTLDRLHYASTAGGKVADSYEAIVGDLDAGSVAVRAVDVTVTDQRATARLAVAWTLAKGETWRYTTTARLIQRGDDWRVAWAPSVVHPKLSPGGRLVAQRQWPDRASIQDRRGRPLVTEQPVVDVGVVPGKVPDPDALAKKLRELLDIEAATLEKRIRAAGPDIFVHVITLREHDFGPLKQQLRALPGVAWRSDTLPLAPTTEFARALLGGVGPVTAQIVEESGGRYQAGDMAGLSGLQARYDRRLAGEPGIRVLAVPPDDGSDSGSGGGASGGSDGGSGGGSSDGAGTESASSGESGESAEARQATTELLRRAPKPGKPVATTLDPRVQQAADAALAKVREKSALVAVHVPSGGVLAVANGPDPGGYNRALRGQYPPGSTFKMISTLALLRAGLGVDDTVRCPKYARVGGKSFRNYQRFALGSVPFRVDFARSCNTAFVELSSRLEQRSLTEAAAAVGVGRTYSLGVPAFSGEVPPAQSAIDQAAATIGQGRVLASPLAMATAAASVARGSYTSPALVTKPRPDKDADASQPAARRLTQEEAGTLQTLLRKVVISGSGQAVADIQGEPVAAKTGTAEYGTADPPKTHAWFVGFQGDVAFAVFVQNGESGGQVAAPIAERFLANLRA